MTEKEPKIEISVLFKGNNECEVSVDCTTSVLKAMNGIGIATLDFLRHYLKDSVDLPAGEKGAVAASLLLTQYKVIVERMTTDFDLGLSEDDSKIFYKNFLQTFLAHIKQEQDFYKNGMETVQ